MNNNGSCEDVVVEEVGPVVVVAEPTRDDGSDMEAVAVGGQTVVEEIELADEVANASDEQVFAALVAVGAVASPSSSEVANVGVAGVANAAAEAPKASPPTVAVPSYGLLGDAAAIKAITSQIRGEQGKDFVSVPGRVLSGRPLIVIVRGRASPGRSGSPTSPRSGPS